MGMSVLPAVQLLGPVIKIVRTYSYLYFKIFSPVLSIFILLCLGI